MKLGFLLLATLGAAYIMCIGLIFAATIVKFLPEHHRRPDANILKKTSNFWLAVFSPLHELDLAEPEDDWALLWECSKAVLYSVLMLVAYAPSVAVIAVWVMLSNGWAICKSLIGKIEQYRTSFRM